MINESKFIDAITYLMECKTRPITETMIKAWYLNLKEFDENIFLVAINELADNNDVRFPNASDISIICKRIEYNRSQSWENKSRERCKEIVQKHLNGNTQELFIQIFETPENYRKLLNDHSKGYRYIIDRKFEEMNIELKKIESKSLVVSGANNGYNSY